MVQQQIEQSVMGKIAAIAAVQLALSNPDLFLDWLSGRSGMLRGASTARSATCPVARYLRTATNLEVEVFAEYCTYVSGGEDAISLPEWAQKAVWYFDVYCGIGSYQAMLSYLRRTLYPEQYS